MAIKKYSKVKFTLRKELIFILAAIVVLVVATILLNLPNEKEKFIDKWTEAGASTASETAYELFEEVSLDELQDLLKGATGYTYVLFATPDSTCTTYFDAVVNYTSKDEYTVEKVYLVDSADYVGDRENDEAFDKKLSDIEKEFTAAEGIELKLDIIPNLWVFNGSELVGTADSYSDVNHALSQLLALSVPAAE